MANNPTDPAPLSLGFTPQQLAEVKRLFNAGDTAGAQQIIFNMLVDKQKLTGNGSTHRAANTG